MRPWQALPAVFVLPALPLASVTHSDGAGPNLRSRPAQVGGRTRPEGGLGLTETKYRLLEPGGAGGASFPRALAVGEGGCLRRLKPVQQEF